MISRHVFFKLMKDGPGRNVSPIVNRTLTLDVRSSAKKFIALSSPKHSQTIRSSFFYILASWSAQLHGTT